MGLLDKIFGSKNQKILKKVQPLVNKINSLEDEFSLLSDNDLKGKRNEFIFLRTSLQLFFYLGFLICFKRF